MTNLLILTPDIPYRCTNYKTYTDDTAETPNEDDFRPHRNSLRGHRYQYYSTSLSYDTPQHNQVYDLGHVSGTANTRACNFVVLSRLDIPRGLNLDIDFQLQSSSDDSSYTARHTINDIRTTTLVGPWENDYVSTFSDTSAFRYWRTNWLEQSATAFDLVIGKIYFGTAFDLLHDPSSIKIERLKPGDSTFTTSGGIDYPVRVRFPAYEITYTWRGITDAKLQSFQDEVVKYATTTPIFLYAQANGEVLTDGKTLIHAWLAACSTQQEKVNWNNIECRFLESLG